LLTSFHQPHHQDELNKRWIDFMDETFICVCGQDFFKNNVLKSMVMNVWRFHELNLRMCMGQLKVYGHKLHYIMFWSSSCSLWSSRMKIFKHSSFLSKGSQWSWKVMILASSSFSVSNPLPISMVLFLIGCDCDVHELSLVHFLC
jgi:hypothetical protein